MKRDDMGMRIDKIRELATKYSKPDLQRMVQMGMVNPQEAVMAGMMIDRISKSAMKPPETTVAEDVLGVAPTAAQGQIPPDQMPQGQMPPQMPPQMAADGGLMGMLPYSDGVAALPSNIHHMAGGGIVAFADGGDVPGYAGGALTSSAPQPMYLPNNIDIERGNIPIYQAEPPKEVTLASSAEQRKAANLQSGVDSEKFFADLKRDVLADKEDFTKQKEEAKGMAILKTGLGLMGARKGREFEKLSSSAQEALSEYGSSLKNIKASEKEMKKDLRQLNMAEQAYKQSNSDKDLAAVNAYQDKLQASKENHNKFLNDAVTKKVDVFKTTKQAESSKYAADTSAAASRYAADTSARSHEKIAGMKGAEERMFDTFHQSELSKNPNQTPLETYKKMKTVSGKEEARAKIALELEKQWNDIVGDITGESLRKVKEMDPTITTGDDYIRKKMALFDKYYGSGAGAGTQPPAATPPSQGGVVVQTPQGSVRFNTQAEADAYKKRVGLQ